MPTNSNPLSSVVIAAAKERAAREVAAQYPDVARCYFVLSIADMQKILRKAKARAAQIHPYPAPGNLDKTGDTSRKRRRSCFVFEAAIRRDPKGGLQVSSTDISRGPQ